MSAEPAVVRLPGEVVERLDELAKSEFRSRSNAATMIISQELERRERADAEETK